MHTIHTRSRTWQVGGLSQHFPISPTILSSNLTDHLSSFLLNSRAKRSQLHMLIQVRRLLDTCTMSHFSCIYCFSWNRVHKKYAKWVLIGCIIEFSIQRALLIEIWVKPQGDKLKIQVEKSIFFTCLFFYHLNHLLNFFYFFTQKNGDSSPMVDIITLNHIGSYKIDFCCTFLFWGPFLTTRFL